MEQFKFLILTLSIKTNTYTNESHENEKIIAISEGNNFKFLNDRITGIQTYENFIFVSSK